MKKLIMNEEGAVNIIVAFSLVGIMALSALVIDAGIFFLEDLRLSNGVDAAALAGGQDLCNNDPFAARNSAEEYALKNGIGPDETEITISADNSAITVKGSREAPLFFGRLFMDADNLKLQKRATVKVGNIGAMTGVAPLGISNADFEYGIRYTLKLAAGDEFEEELGAGNYGALALGAPGASTYEDNLTEGYQGVLSVGDVIDTQTGNISNPTKRSIDKRIANALSTSYEDVQKGCPRVLYVPVFEPHDVGGNQVKSVKIVAFAAFWVEKVEGQGNLNNIYGYFIKMLAEGEIAESAEYRGLKTVKLVE